jgi:hypothetical protein
MLCFCAVSKAQVPPPILPSANCSSTAHFSIAAGANVNISSLVPGANAATNKIFELGAGATLIINQSFIVSETALSGVVQARVSLQAEITLN